MQRVRERVRVEEEGAGASLAEVRTARKDRKVQYQQPHRWKRKG